MKLTIEIEEPEELEKLMTWLHENNLLSQVSVKSTYQPSITRGDKTLDPNGLLGIWKDNPRTLEEIHQAAWERTP